MARRELVGMSSWRTVLPSWPAKGFCFDIRPELIPRVAADAPQETQSDPGRRAAQRRFAIGAPGVRQVVAARNCRVAGECRHRAPVFVLRQESHLDDMTQTIGEPFAGRAHVARILAPDRAQTCLHHVAGGDTRKPHAVAIPETLPVRSVFAGNVEQRAPSSTDGAPQQAGRSDCGNRRPMHALASGNRLDLAARIRCRSSRVCLRNNRRPTSQQRQDRKP